MEGGLEAGDEWVRELVGWGGWGGCVGGAGGAGVGAGLVGGAEFEEELAFEAEGAVGDKVL